MEAPPEYKRWLEKRAKANIRINHIIGMQGWPKKHMRRLNKWARELYKANMKLWDLDDRNLKS